MQICEAKLERAIDFHGHLGPYLVLGILAGELALKKLKCKKYFGSEVRVWGADKKPKSCLIDGLQLSTGATFGKGNIRKSGGALIRIEIKNREDKKKLTLKIKGGLSRRLEELKDHRESELLAKELYCKDPSRIFDLKLIN